MKRRAKSRSRHSAQSRDDDFLYRFVLAAPSGKRSGALMVHLCLNEDGRVIYSNAEPYPYIKPEIAQLAAVRAGLGALPEQRIDSPISPRGGKRINISRGGAEAQSPEEQAR